MIKALSGSLSRIRGTADADTLGGLAGAQEMLQALSGGSAAHAVAGGEKTLSRPMFGIDEGVPFIFERASWLTRDGEDGIVDFDLALGRGVRISYDEETKEAVVVL